jgi:hypothetical protein
MKFYRDNKLYGELIGTTLYKFNQKEKNLFWKFGGSPAIDLEMLNAVKDTATNILVKTDKDRTFKITLEDFLLNAIEIDYGYGKQMCCHARHWEIL